MGSISIKGKDAPQSVPDTPTFVPPGKVKFVPPQAGNANDGGALWWDHDDPGQPGAGGYGGDQGQAGVSGQRGSDGPAGISLHVSTLKSGPIQVIAGGGHGQPGGLGGAGGAGGEGQDGGNDDDEQPAGAGGVGGSGGKGGTGGPGGNGGNAYDVDVYVGGDFSVADLIVSYDQGLGALGGAGGTPGAGGAGGRAGSGGAFAPPGDPVFGDAGPTGTNGKIGTVNIYI